MVQGNQGNPATHTAVQRHHELGNWSLYIQKTTTTIHRYQYVHRQYILDANFSVNLHARQK